VISPDGDTNSVNIPFPAFNLSSLVFSSRSLTASAGGLVPTGERASVGASFFSRVLMSMPWARASSTVSYRIGQQTRTTAIVGAMLTGWPPRM
jgi:hypothetical protein